MINKILIVDDSALMRRFLRDIVNSNSKFQVEDMAGNGVEAFDLLCSKKYAAVILDVNMPKMSGIELLKNLRKYNLHPRVIMVSTDTRAGARVTMEALSLGACDFVQKPGKTCEEAEFSARLLNMLEAVTEDIPAFYQDREPGLMGTGILADGYSQPLPVRTTKKEYGGGKGCGDKLVAIASSTGGPKALGTVLSHLPVNLDAPILAVQHMPGGFTASMAERLDSVCDLRVVEASEGQPLERGVVYVAKGGYHLTVRKGTEGLPYIHYSQEPVREGVRPCANYMYESLAETDFKKIICVVLTGMGSDGRDGIRYLSGKKHPEVIVQSRETCVVYGMPRSVVQEGLATKVLPLEEIGDAISSGIGLTEVSGIDKKHQV